MPLAAGKTRDLIASNIKEMEASGHSHAQSVAAALRNAYDSGAGVMLMHGDRALFLKRGPRVRDHAGEWCCAGGSIEEGETAEQAAKRETQEETGYPVGDITQIDEAAGFATFRANVDEEFTPKLNHEHTEHLWAPLDDPPHPLHPGVAATLRKLLIADVKPNAMDAARDRREYDTNGWFEVLDNPLSKVGVYKYSEASIVKGGDPRKMIGVMRSAQELGCRETVESFRLMPWIDDHPATLLGSEAKGLVPAEDKGVEGVIGEKTYFKDGTLFGNIKVFSEALAKKLASGKRELSLGYHCDFVPERGVFEGEPYEYAQKNLRGNHGASVKAGRMGSEVRVLDGAEPELAMAFALDLKETTMAACPKCGRVHGTEEDCMDAEAHKLVKDSFESLVGKLEKKGYSKEYATGVAGKVAAEKGKTAHDTTDGVHIMAGKDSDKGEIKDPEGKEDPGKKRDLETESADVRDETESKADETESAKDASEEKEDGDKEDKEARDRRRARDKRAGARDARKSARDARRAARDKMAKDAKDAADAKAVKDAKDAADAAAVAASKGKGMDAAEVAALVKKEVAAATATATAAVVPAIRKEENAKHKLYDRLSPIVGAFDHAEMSHVEMAAYGLTKLGVKDAAEDPVTALDFLLLGRAQGTETLGRPRLVGGAQDANGGSSIIDKYLAA